MAYGGRPHTGTCLLAAPLMRVACEILDAGALTIAECLEGLRSYLAGFGGLADP